MAGNPFFQNLDPMSPPDPVTPNDGPGHAPGYAVVTPAGTGPAPAPYDIAAPQNIAGITAAFDTANALSAGGVLYPMGPRQAATEAFLNSPQGTPAMSITDGFPDYENTDPDPGPDMENPIQGTGTPGAVPGAPSPYPGTTQEGVPQFTAGLGHSAAGGLPGVSPETGSMGPGGMDYPGTTQPGVPHYG